MSVSSACSGASSVPSWKAASRYQVCGSPGNWITARSRLSRVVLAPAIVSIAARTSSGSSQRVQVLGVLRPLERTLELARRARRVVRGAVGRLRQPDRPGEQAGGQERDDGGDDAVPLGPPPDPLGRLLRRPARVAAGDEARRHRRHRGGLGDEPGPVDQRLHGEDDRHDGQRHDRDARRPSRGAAAPDRRRRAWPASGGAEAGRRCSGPRAARPGRGRS